MKVTKETLQKVAHLSRLELNKAEEKQMLKSLNDIVEWVDKLSELDTKGVVPLTHMTMEMDISREDEVKNEIPREKALNLAPKQDGAFFRVPKVIE